MAAQSSCKVSELSGSGQACRIELISVSELILLRKADSYKRNLGEMRLPGEPDTATSLSPPMTTSLPEGKPFAGTRQGPAVYDLTSILRT